MTLTIFIHSQRGCVHLEHGLKFNCVRWWNKFVFSGFSKASSEFGSQSCYGKLFQILGVAISSQKHVVNRANVRFNLSFSSHEKYTSVSFRKANKFSSFYMLKKHSHQFC